MLIELKITNPLYCSKGVFLKEYYRSIQEKIMTSTDTHSIVLFIFNYTRHTHIHFERLKSSK